MLKDLRLEEKANKLFKQGDSERNRRNWIDLDLEIFSREKSFHVEPSDKDRNDAPSTISLVSRADGVFSR